MILCWDDFNDKSLVYADKEADGGHRRHIIGKRDTEGNGHGSIDARYGAGHDPHDNAQQDEQNVVQVQGIVKTGKNNVKHGLPPRSDYGMGTLSTYRISR